MNLHDKNIISINFRKLLIAVIPYLRRAIRLIALPYCYIYLINWKECKKNKKEVAFDLIYIFFRFKYYPDNYSMCRFWEKNPEQWVYYYGSGYNPYPKARLEKDVQKKEYQILYDDKEICQTLCEKAGIYVPKSFGTIDPENDYIEKIRLLFTEKEIKKAIVKPINGSAGRDIFIALRENEDNIRIIKENNTIDLKELRLTAKSIMQELVEQHEIMARVAPNSLNTLRVLTLLSKEREAIIVQASVKFGIGKSIVDNWSAGGVCIGIHKKSGYLRKTGLDKYGNIFEQHPISKISFKGFKIPHWDKVLKLSKEVQEKLPYIKLLGLDIGIAKNGPILIEINPMPDLAAEEQANGPILKDKTNYREFKKYDLLYNKYQKNIKEYK